LNILQNPFFYCQKSAGAGRTGTYIAADYLFEQFDATGNVDVKKSVLKMRENRMDMVQNLVRVRLFQTWYKTPITNNVSALK